jgi:sigma-B regulation protein RsbU (phosphoserine phosphatase)
LEEQRAQLIAAEEIQSFLLPKSAPEMDGFEIAGRCFPAEFAAGDYFDYLFLKDGRFLPVVSDVCGHGVGPAILMATVCAHLRSMVAVETDLAQLIRRLNALIFQETPEQRFVTLFIGEIDLVTRSLYYVRCGHPPAIVMNDRGQVMASLDQGDLPLGILPDLKCHREGPVRLRSGDVLLLFSDGALEAVSAGDVQFGRERVIATVQKHREKPAGELIEALYQTAKDFVGTRKIIDDITILVVKVL